MGDDALGLFAAREIRNRFEVDLEVVESQASGLGLLDVFRGYDKVLVIDAVSTGLSNPGFVSEFSLLDFQRRAGFRPHYVGLHDAVELAKKLKIPLPSEIRVLAMEVKDLLVVREGLSPEISSQIPNLVRAAIRILNEWACTVRRPSIKSDL